MGCDGDVFLKRILRRISQLYFSTVFLNCISQLYFLTVFLNCISLLYFSTDLPGRQPKVHAIARYVIAFGQDKASNAMLLSDIHNNRSHQIEIMTQSGSIAMDDQSVFQFDL